MERKRWGRDRSFVPAGANEHALDQLAIPFPPFPASPARPIGGRRRISDKTTTNYPALRCVIPLPIPTDVSVSFEETTAMTTWSLQATRASFSAGTPWNGTGISRITETSTATERTLTLAGSQTMTARPRVYFHLKLDYYAGITNG